MKCRELLAACFAYFFNFFFYLPPFSLPRFFQFSSGCTLLKSVHALSLARSRPISVLYLVSKGSLPEGIINSHEGASLKALANEDTLLRTHYCSRYFLGCANWETFVADTKCLWTKSKTFFGSRTQNLCPQQMLHVRTNGETFVSAIMCPQQCVLVCQCLNDLLASVVYYLT